MLGSLILQQTFDLTDEETVQQYAFNIQWHYSLNISEESDDAKYISLRTLWNNRSIVAQNNLEKDIFNAGTDLLAKVFEVNIDTQRIDSVHIKSNMRRLGRISIFSESVNKFLKISNEVNLSNLIPSIKRLPIDILPKTPSAAFPKSSHPNRKRPSLKSAGTFLIWSSSLRDTLR